MTSRLSIIGILLIMASVTPGLAESTISLGQEIKAFNAGNYSSALEIAQALLKANPKDSTARYYYAQALSKVGRTAEACEQFAHCSKYATDATLKRYCYQAIKNLSSAAPVTQAPRSSPNVTVEEKTLSPNGSSDVTARKSLTVTSAQRELEFQRKQADELIAKARERAAAQMEGIPEYFVRPVLLGLSHTILTADSTTKVENPDYKPAYERTQKELNEQIAAINKDFARRESEIHTDTRRSANIYDEVPPALRSQEATGVTQNRVHPTSSNGFVRNFVNYGDTKKVKSK